MLIVACLQLAFLRHRAGVVFIVVRVISAVFGRTLRVFARLLHHAAGVTGGKCDFWEMAVCIGAVVGQR